jgi:hypothetical protein
MRERDRKGKEGKRFDREGIFCRYFTFFAYAGIAGKNRQCEEYSLEVDRKGGENSVRYSEGKGGVNNA